MTSITARHCVDGERWVKQSVKRQVFGRLRKPGSEIAEVTCCDRAFHKHADQQLGKFGHRRLRDVYGGQSEMPTRQSEDAVEPRSRPTDAARRQGTALLSRADICTQRQRVWTRFAPAIDAVAGWHEQRDSMQRTPTGRLSSAPTRAAWGDTAECRRVSRCRNPAAIKQKMITATGDMDLALIGGCCGAGVAAQNMQRQS